jgi:hypothetical protein
LHNVFHVNQLNKHLGANAVWNPHTAADDVVG